MVLEANAGTRLALLLSAAAKYQVPCILDAPAKHAGSRRPHVSDTSKWSQLSIHPSASTLRCEKGWYIACKIDWGGQGVIAPLDEWTCIRGLTCEIAECDPAGVLAELESDLSEFRTTLHSQEGPFPEGGTQG